jgi:hypothetical protein
VKRGCPFSDLDGVGTGRHHRDHHEHVEALGLNRSRLIARVGHDRSRSPLTVLAPARHKDRLYADKRPGTTGGFRRM